MNSAIVKLVREQLARIRHLSAPALRPEVRTLITFLSASEREQLRTLALLVVQATGRVGDHGVPP